jgi:hypothetical protein
MSNKTNYLSIPQRLDHIIFYEWTIFHTMIRAVSVRFRCTILTQCQQNEKKFPFLSFDYQ